MLVLALLAHVVLCMPVGGLDLDGRLAGPGVSGQGALLPAGFSGLGVMDNLAGISGHGARDASFRSLGIFGQGAMQALVLLPDSQACCVGPECALGRVGGILAIN